MIHLQNQTDYEYNRLMSIYSGFPTRKDEQKYNILLSKLILALQNHIIELVNKVIPQDKANNYCKIIAKMRQYEEHKYLPPKFSQLVQPLCCIIGFDSQRQQKHPPLIRLNNQQICRIHPERYKLSSRSLHKPIFNQSNLLSQNISNQKIKKIQDIEDQSQIKSSHLIKKNYLQKSKFSKPQMLRGIFPADMHEIQLSQQYQQSDNLDNKRSQSKSKIQRNLFGSKMENIRYKAYEALQEAQININKRPIPLRQQMKRKLKTESENKRLT